MNERKRMNERELKKENERKRMNEREKEKEKGQVKKNKKNFASLFPKFSK